MPIDQPNFLTPTGRQEDKNIDELKRWIAGDTDNSDFEADDTELTMALKAATDHIDMDLHIYADSLIRQAQTDEYGPMEIEGGEKVFRKGKGFDWEKIPMESIAKAKREDMIKTIESAREDVVWLKKQIRRLESFMEKARERKGQGYDVPLRFVADERPS